MNSAYNKFAWLLVCLFPVLAVAQISTDPALVAKANAGDAAAQVALGEQYAQAGTQEHDKDLAADEYKQAESWYRKAAGQNYIPGELHLAALYRDGGKGIDRSPEQAAVWYRKAAEQGDVFAQGTLGVLYSMGLGVSHDDAEAYFWLDLAAAVPGPDQEKYAANRQMVGTHITTAELEDVQDRVAAWKKAHPRAGETK